MCGLVRTYVKSQILSARPTDQLDMFSSNNRHHI